MAYQLMSHQTGISFVLLTTICKPLCVSFFLNLICIPFGDNIFTFSVSFLISHETDNEPFIVATVPLAQVKPFTIRGLISNDLPAGDVCLIPRTIRLKKYTGVADQA